MDERYQGYPPRKYYSLQISKNREIGEKLSRYYIIGRSCFIIPPALPGGLVFGPGAGFLVLTGERLGDSFESCSAAGEDCPWRWSFFPHPLTRRCLFRASFLLKLFSQLLQGKGLTARWILLCRFKSWFRLKLWGHWSHLKGRSVCCCW